LSPPGYRIRQEGWKKATIRLTVLKASVRPTSARIAIPQICGGHSGRRAQTHFRSVLRSGTLK
jgi:hypothetical protein